MAVAVREYGSVTSGTTRLSKVDGFILVCCISNTSEFVNTSSIWVNWLIKGNVGSSVTFGAAAAILATSSPCAVENPVILLVFPVKNNWPAKKCLKIPHYATLSPNI